MIDTLKQKLLNIIDKIFKELENDKIGFPDNFKSQIISNIKQYLPDNYYKAIEKVNNYIEYIYFFPDINYNLVENIINESIKYNYSAICIPQIYTKYAKQIINKSKSNLNISTCIGFPYGNTFFETKIEEAKIIANTSIDEVNIILNISFLKEKRLFYIYNELYDIKKICNKKILKINIENYFLTFEEKIIATLISYLVDIDFISNSSTFCNSDIKLEDIILMKMITGNRKIEACGNINTKEYAMELLNHGADRIGISNPSLLINYK